MAKSLLDRITIKPGVCGGRPCIRGTRMRVTDILELLSVGVTEKAILKDYPYIEAEDIRAAMAYAARQTDHAVLRSA